MVSHRFSPYVVKYLTCCGYYCHDVLVGRWLMLCVESDVMKRRGFHEVLETLCDVHMIHQTTDDVHIVTWPK